ncbi:MAG TPA: Rha family transcriptional regulator [Cedecea sp.]
MFLQIALAFLWVKSYFHEFIVCTLINKSNIDSLSSGRYSALAAAKSVAGLRIPEFSTAHNRASSGFFMRAAFVHLSMVAQAGASSEAPVSVEAGNANSVWATTNHSFASVGGSKKHSTEAAIMATIPTVEQPEITFVNGRAVTTSLAVAAYFVKEHKNVIQKIQSLECSPGFTALNFQLSDYTDTSGRKLPCYQITRDGFAFLAMSFTGKRAAHFKEMYITAFNAMEQALIQRSLKTASGLESIHNHAQHLHENLSIIMAIWADNVQPLNPPIVVSGTVMDAYHRSGLIAAGIARAMRRESK